jgi:hypothetical protein
LDGSTLEIAFDEPTVVVAIKESCDGCREFVVGSLDALADVKVVVVSATMPRGDEWSRAVREVLVAPELLDALGLRGAPHYVLVLPGGPRVVAEGAVFSASQVASEIASHLT